LRRENKLVNVAPITSQEHNDLREEACE